MTVEVANESGADVDERAIVAAARFSLDWMRVHPQAELSVLLVRRDVMAELHQRWMDLPGPTDVLAFPMDDDLGEAGVAGSRRPDSPPAGPAVLGDLVLCPAVAAQAAQQGHSLTDELALLTVHGVLHLLGYDHAEPDEERAMFALQDRILDEYRRAGRVAAQQAAQRDADSRVLGTVGLDGPEPSGRA